MSRIATTAADASPAPYRTPEQRAAEREAAAQAQKAWEKERPGFIGSTLSIVDDGRDALSRRLNDPLYGLFPYEADPNFKLTPDLLESYGDGIPEDLWEDFSFAVNADHAQMIRERLLKRSAAERRLGELGAVGMAARFLAEMLDPVDLAFDAAATVAVGGLSAPATIARRGARLTQIVKAGMVSGNRLTRAAKLGVVGATGATVGEIVLDDPRSEMSDYVVAALSGFTLGGVIGGATNQRMSRALRLDQADAELESVVRAAMGAAAPAEIGQLSATQIVESVVTEKGRRIFQERLSKRGQQRVLDRVLNLAGLDPKHDKAIIDGIKGDQDAIDALTDLVAQPGQVPTPAEVRRGVQQVLPDEQAGEVADVPDKIPGDLRLEVEEEPGDVRFKAVRSVPIITKSLGATLGTSQSKLMQAFGKLAVSDPVLRKGGKVTQSASEWVRRRTQTQKARFHSAHEQAYRAWRDENGKGRSAVGILREREQFETLVGNAAAEVGDDLDSIQSPAVRNAVRAVRASLDDGIEMAARHGVRGSELVQAIPNYFPRIYSPPAIHRAINRYGRESINDLMAGAIISAQPDIDVSLARAMARGMLQTIIDSERFSDLDQALMFAGGNAEALADSIRKHVPSATEEQINRALRLVKEQDANAATPSRLRHRVTLDETFSIEVDGGRLSLSDLLDRNAPRVVNNYIDQLHGAAAITELGRALGASTGRTLNTQGDILRALEEDLKASGATTSSVGEQIEIAQRALRSIAGQAVTPHRNYHDFLRRMRALNYINVSGQFGVAQLPEIFLAAGELGAEASIRSLPGLTKFLKRARDGSISNQELDELAALSAAATDSLAPGFSRRFDSGSDLDPNASRRASAVGERVDDFLGAGGRVSGIASLMTPVNNLMQSWATRAAMHNFYRTVRTGKRPSVRRLAAIGLDEQQAGRIVTAMKKEIDAGTIVEEDTLVGRRIGRLNLGAWEDQQAASDLFTAVDLWANRVVQRNDIGNLTPWMMTEWGKVALQFKSFHLAAFEKQLLAEIAIGDIVTARKLTMSLIPASLIYAGAEYVNSLGRPDAEEYRAERLSVGAVAKAGFQRVGWSSILPDLVDSAALFGYGDSVFNYRNSGLATGIFNPNTTLTGNPTFNYGSDLFRTLSSLTRAVTTGEDFSESDANTASRLLPFRRVWGVKNAIDAAVGSFPEEER